MVNNTELKNLLNRVLFITHADRHYNEINNLSKRSLNSLNLIEKKQQEQKTQETLAQKWHSALKINAANNPALAHKWKSTANLTLDNIDKMIALAQKDIEDNKPKTDMEIIIE